MNPRVRSRTPWNERPVVVPQEVLDLADEADVESLVVLLSKPRGLTARELVSFIRILVETQHIGSGGSAKLSPLEVINLRRVAALALLALRESKADQG